MREKLSNAAKILRRKEKLSKFYDAVAKHMIQSQPDRATTPCTMASRLVCGTPTEESRERGRNGFSKDEDKKGACLRKTPQESWEIFDFRLGSLAFEDSARSACGAEDAEVNRNQSTGTKLKALKSCLVCLISFGHTHLESHQRVSSLKRHQLVEPGTLLKRSAARPVEMVSLIRVEAISSVEVPCDIFTGTKLKAQKSCLVYHISFGHTHLESHQRVSSLKRHQLVEPLDSLDHRICKKHDRLLEFFCQTEQVCLLCTMMDHKSHPEVKTAQLGKIEAEVQQMIQER
ncbi:unnamed protein product [Boreogadus saida]